MACGECHDGQPCSKRRKFQRLALFAGGGALGAAAGAGFPFVVGTAAVAGLVVRGEEPFPLGDVLLALVAFEVVRRMV